MEPKKYVLSEILANLPAFSAIVNKVDQLSKLNRELQQKLDPELQPHCRVANLRDGLLVLTTPSPATAHLLRFAKPELLSALRSDPLWCHLTSIEIHVQPEQTRGTTLNSDPSPPLPAPRLSKTSALDAKNAALSIANTSLQEALMRLANKNKDLR